MRNNEHSTVSKLLFDRFLDSLLSLQINICSSLIKDQYFLFCNQSSRKTNLLFLSLAQVPTVGLNAHFQPTDLIVLMPKVEPFQNVSKL